MTLPTTIALDNPDTAPEHSCRALATVALYFEKIYGRDRLEETYRQLGSALPLEYVLDKKNFVSFDFVCRFVDLLADGSGDPDFARKSGLFIATPQAMGFAYYMLRALGTPKLAYQQVVKLGPSYNRTGRFEIEELTDRRLKLSFQSTRHEPNRRICDVRIGQFASFPTIWGLPPARVRETSCQVMGADKCRYEIAWNLPAQRPLLVAAVGAIIGASLAWFLFAPAVGHLAGSALGLAIGGSLAAVLGYRAISRAQGELLRTQNEGLVGSMSDLESRYEEIRELNATLEKRVEQRTQELSIANAALQTALEKAKEADRLKTEFFQNVSHEFRTPLNLITVPVDNLIVGHHGYLTDEQRKHLDIARVNANRLLALVNSLLDLARYDAGVMRLTLDDADPANILGNLVDSAKGLAQRRGVELSLDCPESLGPVPLDLDKFERAVLNLISNGIKFSAEVRERPPQVNVFARIEEARLVVRVKDNGIGIPASELPQLFTRFHQVDGSEQRQYGGTGIGLALVKEIVEFQGGEVKVSSTLDQGSTFEFRLPTDRAAYPQERLDRRRVDEKVAIDRRQGAELKKLATVISNPADLVLADLSQAEVPPEDETDLVLHPERAKVLIADDNRDMLAYLKTILGREYHIITATDGEEAFQVAQKRLPQIIVADVMMPRKSGFSLVSDLKKHPLTKAIPIILVTARGDIHQKVQGIEFGADDYLTKPFNFLELRARLKHLLHLRALERSLAEKNEHLAKVNFELVLAKKEVFLQTIEAMAFAVEAKDLFTHGHSRRVSLLATELGRKLEMTELEIERVRISAVLHDVGKLGIPEQLLRKEGRLTPEEEEIVRQHPEIGYRILESVEELAGVNRCILMHHERFDGSGYPTRRAGYDIPFESRIIAVADAYDAMTSDRPYRRGVGHARAIQELRDFAGTQFDPDVVRAFLDLYEERPPVFPVFPSLFAKSFPEGLGRT